MECLLLIRFATTWFMVGLIWVIQVVHYPLFAKVGEPQFTTYSKDHQFRITWIVGPVMMTELVTAIALAWFPPQPESQVWLGIALALLVTIWFSTALIQVPQHGRLVTDWDLQTVSSLTRGNWIRTIAWTARGTILGVVLLQSIVLDPSLLAA